MNASHRIRLAKSADDHGFVCRMEAQDGWLSFGSLLCPVRIWLTAQDGGLVLALSDSAQDVQGVSWPGLLPEGAVCAVRASSYDALSLLLERVHVRSGILAQPPIPRYEASADPRGGLAEAIKNLPATEAVQIVQRRIGQDLFRALLMARQSGRCAITGLAVPELLRASHIKPWAEATDAERLDPSNGLLLAAHLDAAFDRGLMTVEEDGTLRWSARLDAAARTILGVDAGWRVRLTQEQQAYLRWHRARVFQAA